MNPTFARSAVFLFCLLLGTVAASPDTGAWLSVQDFGASGSKFEALATTTAGSKQVIVAKAGDFKAGQGVMISKANPRFLDGRLWGPRKAYAKSAPVGDRVQIRGYDGRAGSWVVYVLDMPAGTPGVFRWTDDLGRTWHEKVPITGQWQPLADGVEARLGKHDWESGYTATFIARDQLITTIEKIEGNTLTLKDAPTRSVKDAVVRHCDSGAIQAAVDRALKEKRNVHFPVGHYRLAGSIRVENASMIVLEGQSAVDTLLDISEGEGACFSLKSGTDVTLRNFRMTGHMGFDSRDQAGNLRTRGGTAVWGFYFKHCNAVGINNTQRVRVENCHATRMSAECFYSAGRARRGHDEPKQYPQAITYERCSVVDCARNAFNNNDMAENTSVLYCRIVDVGGCSWEGASRFVRFIGNYVRNGGTVAMGNIRSRSADFEILPSGQHIIADNVFESGVPYGGCMIRAAGGAQEVIVRNNLFVNFNGSAVDISGGTGVRDLPASTATVTGNIFDLTAVGEPPRPRIAIDVSASGVIVGDNQVYVRGACDPTLTGIRLRESAIGVNVHDNLIRNCGTAIAAVPVDGRVGQVVSPTVFLRAESPLLPTLENRASHRYRGWNVVWTAGQKAIAASVLESFDPETLEFHLAAPRALKPGDTFQVYPPLANWTIHQNLISGCQSPLVLEAWGSPMSVLSQNLLERGAATGVAEAVLARGRFQLVDNQFYGFDEPKAAGIRLAPDRLGRSPESVVTGNTFRRCSQSIAETAPGLLKACLIKNNPSL